MSDDDVVRRPVERLVPEAARPPVEAGLRVDTQGFICAGGVRVARLVERGGRRWWQFRDPCKPRARKRGTQYVEVPASEVAELAGADGNGIMREEG